MGPVPGHKGELTLPKSRRPTGGLPALYSAWLGLGSKTAEMLTASAFVINARTQQLAKSSAPLRGQDAQEARRMVSEKFAAATESCLAMSQACVTMQTRMLTDIWQTALLQGSLASPRKRKAIAKASATNAETTASEILRCTQAGLEPIRKRAVANRKRLAKKR